MTEASQQVISGLEGVLAFESSIAFIDGSIPELSFRGYDIQDIALTLTFEQAAYLLWHDRLPSDDELAVFSADLAGQRAIPEALIDILRGLPASSHPMAALRTVVSWLGAMDAQADDNGVADNLRKATALTAQMPTIVAAQARLQQGQEPVAPRADLSHAANYCYMLTGEIPDDTTTRTFDTMLILYAEHETNASTFACRVVVGTEADLYSAVVAGLGAIKGPLHGGAIDDVMRMLIDIGSPDRAAAFVDEALAARRKLPGFGHRVYRAGDPRASQLRGMAEKLDRASRTTKSDSPAHAGTDRGSPSPPPPSSEPPRTRGDEPWFAIATAAEQRMRDTKGIIANVDYFAAPVLYHLGFPLSIFTNVLASTRIVGWSAHILEQYANNRLIRPRAKYVGHRGRKLES